MRFRAPTWDGTRDRRRIRLTLTMLLVVEDDPAALRALERLLGDRPRVYATSGAEARTALTTLTGLTGCLLDVGLPEGPRAGLELLEWIRNTALDLPCALVTGTCEADVVNAGERLRATVIIKPATAELLAWVLEQGDRPTTAELPTAIARQAKVRYELTKKETEVVAWFVAGRDLAAFLAHAKVSRSTFKSHRTRILLKTGASSLEMLASRLLHAQLESERLQGLRAGRRRG